MAGRGVANQKSEGALSRLDRLNRRGRSGRVPLRTWKKPQEESGVRGDD